MLDLSPRGRIVLAGAWLALQAALVFTAGRRADRAFGFQMFNESSTIEIHLSRVMKADGRVVPIEGGAWPVSTGDGVVESVRWGDRVKDARLAIFDRAIPAAYGIEAQLARLQAALDDVATNTPIDHETSRLVADVIVVRNGRPPYTVRLTSVPR